MRNRFGSSFNLDTTVVGLQGHPISTDAPTAGQALVFDGTDWVPTTVQTGGGGAAVGATPPASPNTGDLWFNTGDNTLNVWNGTEWLPADSANAIVQINNVLPASPATGELYWDLVTAKLFLFDGTQWVATINTPEGANSGGGGGGGPPPAVIDGSNAAPGSVGEQLSADATNNAVAAGTPTTLTSLTLTPGDWLVSAGISWAGGANSYGVAAWLSTTNNGGNNIGTPYGAGVESPSSTTLVNFNGSTGILRFNTATGRTIFWVVYSLGGPAPAYAEGWINAYRWR